MKGCLVCGNPIRQPATGRRRQYCSHACRQLAYRRRHGGQAGSMTRATIEANNILDLVFRHAGRGR